MHGTCDLYCPESEVKLRTKERLLHFYEYKNGQKNIPGTLIKCFARSAAGVKKPHPRDMRTERCLQQTVDYLLKDILLDKRKPYNFAYDFIFDRLRAVRQELVMQHYNAKQIVRLLEPMILFLAYSRYRLCEEVFENFDPAICEQHLQECLKRVLTCYDEIDINLITLSQLRNRCFIEALYQIFNMGTPEALWRGLTLPNDVRKDIVFEQSFRIGMNYHRKNYYAVLSELTKLPHILCAIGSLKMQQLRRNILLIFSHAYNNKQLTVQVDFVCRILQLSNKQQLFFDICKYYNIQILSDKKSVQFLKSDFKSNVEIFKSQHEDFVEEKLQRIYLPEVLLLKKL